jgi:hypothetical protein
MITKDSRAYRTNYLRQNESIRDHGIAESGVVSRVNADADDLCVSAVNPAQRAINAEPATPAAG